MGKAALGELQKGEAVLGPPCSPCRAADLLQCRQTRCPRHQANHAKQSCTCCPFALIQELVFLNTCFLLAASMDFLKNLIYLFISFFPKKCGNEKAHSSQHTMTWPALLDAAQPDPGCGRAQNGTIPLAAPAAKAAFSSDTNYTQIQPLILTPWFSPDLSMSTHGALAAECHRWMWVMRRLSWRPNRCFLFAHVLVQWFDV